MSAPGPHILLYPYPGSGHIIPFLDLAHCFLTRGLTVTVALTPDTSPLLQPLLSRHVSSVHSLVLPSPEPPPANSTIPRSLFIIRCFRQIHYQALLQWFRSHLSPPIAIISDIFFGWTNTLAAEVGVPRIVFSSTGAFGYSVTNSLALNPPTRIGDQDDEADMLAIQDLPKCPKYPWYQISLIYRNFKEGDPDREFYRANWLDNLASWGVAFNSFHHLEHPYVDYMKKVAGHSRVWAVGPVLPSNDKFSEPENRGGPSSVPYHDLLTWLNAHKDDSVVYVCFGSRHVLTRRQMDELAVALEKSGVHFVWCIKESGNRHVVEDRGVIPDGFEDRVAGRGFLIRGWAPQVAILSHRAVGAFLTHCGWNSTLEGITAGVVMLTWPMGADQFTNAKLLVDELGVGIRVGESTKNIPESGVLARLLVESVGHENKLERDRVKRLSEEALDAVHGGSSEKDLDELVKMLCKRRAEN